MGYDLYWVNDPHEQERAARVERFIAETDDVSEVMSGMYAVAAQDGAYFRASIGVMAAIRHELEHQGLGDLAMGFVANEGVVSPDMIRCALEHIRLSPTMPADVSNSGDDFLAKLLPDDMSDGAVVTSGGDALMDATPGTWQAKWESFVNFLRSAVNHGGVQVS